MEIKFVSKGKIKVAGLDVQVVSDEEAEKADLVVCVEAGTESEEFKKDNIYTNCVDCGVAITHRPHAPKKPPKVCMLCAVTRSAKNEEDPDPADIV